MAQTEGAVCAKVGCPCAGEQVYAGSCKSSDMTEAEHTRRVAAETRLKSRPGANTKSLAGQAKESGPIVRGPREVLKQ